MTKYVSIANVDVTIQMIHIVRARKDVREFIIAQLGKRTEMIG